MFDKKQWMSVHTQTCDGKPLEWMANVFLADIESGETRYVNGFVGKVQAPLHCTAAQLDKFGYVGIYRREGDKDFRVILKDSHKREASSESLRCDPV